MYNLTTRKGSVCHSYMNISMFPEHTSRAVLSFFHLNPLANQATHNDKLIKGAGWVKIYSHCAIGRFVATWR